MANPIPVWSVSEVNSAIRDLVEGSLMPLWVAGEVGSITLHRSGHAYFTLKDRKCQLRAVFFNGVKACEQEHIVNGSRIEAFGSLTVYEARGEYQLSIRQLRPAGQGDLQKRFEQLRDKLQSEGLFEPSRKRPIPFLPRRVGVITSGSGAAIRDFLNIIEQRKARVEVMLYPCAVQGATAAAEVARGLEFFNRSATTVDLIVVTRGGGSMEDLWPFNDEKLVRAVAASKIPVISAVGHEIDFSLCDFAADQRQPTPTAAAEAVAAGFVSATERLERSGRELRLGLAGALSARKLRFERLEARCSTTGLRRRIENSSARVDEFDTRILRAAERLLGGAATRLEKLAATVCALDPARQLERGYAIIYDPAAGRPVTSVEQAPPGAHLRARLADGALELTVDDRKATT